MSFNGFVWPKENWFRLPNEWTNIMAGMTSMAEVKVVLYVMRHTWGYNKPERLKKITTDEFMNGRKRKNGSRMDQGTGLKSQGTVIQGIKQAIEHGFLEVEADDSDKARRKKFYRLKMVDLRKSESGVRKSESGSTEIGERGTEIGERSGKDTFGKTLLKERGTSLVEKWNKIEGVRKVQKITSPREKQMAARFKEESWEENLDDALNKVAESSFCLGENDRGWKADIDWFLRPNTMTKLLEGSYGNGKVHDKYNRTPKEKELDDVRSKLLNGQMELEGRTWKPSQEELDGVLMGMGIEAGKYFPGEI